MRVCDTLARARAAGSTQPWSERGRAATPLDGTCVNPEIEQAVQDVLAHGIREASLTDHGSSDAGRKQSSGTSTTAAAADTDVATTDERGSDGTEEQAGLPKYRLKQTLDGTPQPSDAAQGVDASTKELIQFGKDKLEATDETLTEDFVRNNFHGEPGSTSARSGGSPASSEQRPGTPRMREKVKKAHNKHKLVSHARKTHMTVPEHKFRKPEKGEKVNARTQPLAPCSVQSVQRLLSCGGRSTSGRCSIDCASA